MSDQAERKNSQKKYNTVQYIATFIPNFSKICDGFIHVHVF